MKLLCSIKYILPAIAIMALVGCISPKEDIAAGRDNYFQQNYEASFERIRRAAKSGDPDAEYALGYMYYYGKGTDQDIELARSWIQKAAAQGQPMATKALALLDNEQAQGNTTLNPGQVQEQAQAKARTKALGSDFKGNKAAAVQATPANNTLATGASGFGQQLLAMNGGYTIQIMSSDRQASLTHFMRAHNLSEKAYIYRKNFKGKELYVLVYGAYSTSTEAQRAAKNLPSYMQGNRPWVKPVSQIKSEIQ